MNDYAAPASEAVPDERETRWLTPDEKEAWSGLVSLILLLPNRLDSPLRELGLTLFEYLTLSHISDAPDQRLRMGDLAYLANGSQSRLSNVVKRFEQRNWVSRSPDPTDGRYTIAALTDLGYQVVVAAAPTHVETVHRLALDLLSKEDQCALVRIGAALRAGQDETNGGVT